MIIDQFNLIIYEKKNILTSFSFDYYLERTFDKHVSIFSKVYFPSFFSIKKFHSNKNLKLYWFTE